MITTKEWIKQALIEKQLRRKYKREKLIITFYLFLLIAVKDKNSFFGGGNFFIQILPDFLLAQISQI